MQPRIVNAILVAMALSAAPLLSAQPPRVGDKAPDFALKALDGPTARLSELTARGDVVALVVLRGWPGYQCPICNRQVQEFIASAPAFAEAKVQLVFVYPGPPPDLMAHAEEFKTWKGRQWPKHFLYVLDPDYGMVNTYGLRWDAPKETAYPSTFVIDRNGVVRFVKVSHGHGDRAKSADVLAEAKKISGR